MNNKNKNEKGGSWFARIAALALCAAFAVGFGSVGIGALKSLTAMLHGAWTARSWQPVPAEVLDSGLSSKPDGDGGATYTVHARYRYEWTGHAYESTTVGLADKGSDNIDGWHHDWDARLRAARSGGAPVTAWVDPQHAERALLDPHLRWRKLLFMLPFAILFPMVALGAVCAIWVVVSRAVHTQAAPEQRHVPRQHALGLWLLATLVCVMTLPAIAMASSARAPIWVALIAGLFSLVGLVLLRMAVRATRRAWIYQGTFASFQPAQPRGGAAFLASWVLPPRAAAHWPPGTTVRLRVAQYRIDDSGSGTTERLVEDLTQHVRPHPSPDDGLGLQARFELPADAPSQGSRRSGEKVEWRLEWLDAKDGIVLMVPIPVQAAVPRSDAAGDRFSPAARMPQRALPAGPVGDDMPPLPAGVSLHEGPDALALGFQQTVWRRVGAAAVVALMLAFTRSSVWLEAALLAFGLHALSRQWTLEMRDDSLLMNCTSWLWQRRFSVPARSLPGLYQRWRRGRDDKGDTAGYHALYARGVDRGNDVRLTPGLHGTGAAQVAQVLHWARAHRAGRFSPGALREEATNASRPAWGWLLCLLWVVARLSMG